jgi:S1-C subfamily serine protease
LLQLKNWSTDHIAHVKYDATS